MLNFNRPASRDSTTIVVDWHFLQMGFTFQALNNELADFPTSEVV
jgi:hypothetical protein